MPHVVSLISRDATEQLQERITKPSQIEYSDRRAMIASTWLYGRRRSAQLIAASRSGGIRELGQRAARRAYVKTNAASIDFPLAEEDIADSDTITWHQPTTASRRPLTVTWLMTPPSPGSGGHTTIFRMVEALESAGHTCQILLHDRHHTQAKHHTQVIRQHWPKVKASVDNVSSSPAPADAYVATGWPSAHILGRLQTTPGARVYFVQDYEPYFYPRGTEYALAEDTYRFGFRTVVLGGLVADTISRNHGCEVARIPFGTDLNSYRLTNIDRTRHGVVFFARPGVPRRGYELGMAALAEFHRQCPDQDVHIFGASRVQTRFPATVHGTLSPTELAQLYNQTAAGLALSFTNISLVPYEMLACGTTPVMNKDPYAQAELVAPEARWAEPRPIDLANALVKAVAESTPATAAAAAQRVATTDWAASQEAFVRIIENEVFSAAARSTNRSTQLPA